MALTLLAALVAPAAAQSPPIKVERVEPIQPDQPEPKAKDEVIVITEKAPEEVESVTYELTPDLIRKMPGSGNDAIKSLQTMPSVGRVPFGMGGLILRGTSPRDSNVFLDGIEVPLLYHFGGLASFYPSALLKSLELTPGGYSSQYGRGQGGVVTLESNAARTDRWRVASEMSMIDAALQADGPSGNWGAWSIAMRRSYIDVFLPLVGGSHETTNAPRYYDGQLRFDTDPWRGAHLTVMLFGSDDEIGLRYGLDNARSFRFSTQFARFGARLTQRYKNTVFKAVPWVGVDRYHLASSFQTMRSENDPMGLRASSITDFTNGYISVGTDLSAGAFAVSSLTIDDEDDTETAISRDGTYLDSALWVEGLVQLFGKRVGIKPGLRLEHYGLSDALVLDPRLVLTQKLSDVISLRQSIGTYHQPPGVADALWGNDDLAPSYSVQTSFGGTADINRNASVSLTGFYSELYNLAVDDPDADDSMFNNFSTYKIGAIASSREFIAKQFGTFSTLANIGRGQVYGVELMTKYVTQRAFAWLAYTYSRSKRRIEDDMTTETAWVLDQPHVLTAVGSLQLGKHWRVGARFRYASGNPYTPLVGRTQVGFDKWDPVFGDENSERLGPFFQVDLRVDRDWKRSWGTITAFLDVQNATRRTNVEGRVYAEDYSGFEPTGGLPLFPSFGIAYTPSGQ